MKKLLVSFLILESCVLSLASFPDSIWNSNASSPYSVSKAFKVGDIVTIIILETTSAAQKAGTDTNASDSLAASFNSNLQSMYHPSKAASGSLGNTYKGLGSTTRTSNVTAKVAAVVIKVLPNGNLIISGEHKVEVNDEMQTIKISGMIRPKDVSLQNSVYSYQVAGATVSVKGTGSVNEAGEPGILSRIFNWVF